MGKTDAVLPDEVKRLRALLGVLAEIPPGDPRAEALLAPYRRLAPDPDPADVMAKLDRLGRDLEAPMPDPEPARRIRIEEILTLRATNAGLRDALEELVRVARELAFGGATPGQWINLGKAVGCAEDVMAKVERSNAADDRPRP